MFIICNRELSQLIDVLSEKEHMPGAVNISFFNNEERVHIGTVYKQCSMDKVIELCKS